MYRREFLSYAAGIVTLPALIDSPRHGRIEVLDLGEHCALRESVAGYTCAVAAMAPAARRAVFIVPAAGQLSPAVLHKITSALHWGAVVVLESGAAFVEEPLAQAHCNALRESLGVGVKAPVQLWPRRTPYVDYTWPHAAKLRDFSRVIPLDQPTGETIGFADGQPVALRRQVARGTFIFLGSPLGPALWAGDRDANRWLRDVIRS